MAAKDRNLNVGITSSFDGRGFKSAEQSAKVLERELDRQEQKTRQMAGLHTQAAREMAAAEAEKAAVIERVNARQRQAMEATGRVVMGLSLAAAAGFALTAKAAIDWESDWAGVTKTVDGTTEEMNLLEGQLRSLARSLPATHGEIAAVAEAAGQLGVKRENVAAFTRTMVALGETTNLSADEAATALAQLSNIMGTSADDVSRLGSTLVALGNDGASTERDIVTMAQRMAGAGKLVGATEGEVLALSSALSSMGVTAELGGGVASRVMQDLYSVVQTGGDKLGDFAKIAGMSASDFAAAFREDPVRALALFTEGLNGVEASGGNVVTTLSDIGFKSSEEQRILLQLKANTDLVTDALDLQSEAWAENTALTDEANKRYQTTEARLQIARNQINDAAIDIGGNFLPAVASATEAVGAMATGFGSLPDSVQTWVTGLGTAATAVGLLGGGALIAVPKLVEFRKTVDALHGGSSRLGKIMGGTASVLTGPWGIALAGATIGVALWAKAQGEAVQKVQALAETLDGQTGALTENSTAWIQSELTKDQSFGIRNTQSMAEAAKEMGISIETLTKAYEGQPAAIDEAKAKAEAWAEANRDWSLASDSQSDRFIRNLDDQSARLEDAAEIAGAKKDIDAAATNQQGDLADEYAATNPLIDAQSDVLGEVTGAADTATEALGEYLATLSELTGVVLSEREAQRALEEAYDSFNGTLETNGATLDITTEKGRANQAALDNIASSTWDLIGAMAANGAEHEQLEATMASARAEFINAAEAAGIETEAANALADQLGLIPANVTTAITVAGVAAAKQQIEDLRLLYDGKTIAQATIDVFERVIGAGGTRGQGADAARYTGQALAGARRQADGGVVEFYGSGGVRENHVAQIAPAGAWRVWAEDETEGEGYVPLARSKRPRSEEIMGEIAARLGGAYIPSQYVGHYAGGAVLGAAGGPTPSPGPTFGALFAAEKVEVLRGGPEEVAADLAWKLMGKVAP
ncbi:MAG: phage tail tape measure protein [Georgenia sp.]